MMANTSTGLLAEIKPILIENIDEKVDAFLSTKNWTEEEERTFAWAGNGWPLVPTVEYFRGGTVLFITQDQLQDLHEKIQENDSTFLEHVESAFGEEDLFLEYVDDIFVVDEN